MQRIRTASLPRATESTAFGTWSGPRPGGGSKQQSVDDVSRVASLGRHHFRSESQSKDPGERQQGRREQQSRPDGIGRQGGAGGGPQQQAADDAEAARRALL